MDDAKLRHQLGEVGRWRAANILNWERQEEVLLAAYDSMLSGAAKRTVVDSQLSVSDLSASCAVESRPLCESGATADSLS